MGDPGGDAPRLVCPALAPGWRSRACLQTHFPFCAALLCPAGPWLRGVPHTAAPGCPGPSHAECSSPQRLRPRLRDAAEGEATGACPSLARPLWRAVGPAGSGAVPCQGLGDSQGAESHTEPLWGSPLAHTCPLWGWRAALGWFWESRQQDAMLAGCRQRLGQWDPGTGQQC